MYSKIVLTRALVVVIFNVLGTFSKLIKTFNFFFVSVFSNAAYFGLDLCEPKPGETIVVSCAAGGVGNHVGQLAKLIGIIE